MMMKDGGGRDDDDDEYTMLKDFTMTTPYQLNGILVKDTDKYKNK